VSARPVRRKICFVLPSLAGGGAERAAVQILNALDDRNWERSMYLFRNEGPYLADVSPAVYLRAGTGDSRIGRWQALRRFVRETRPEIVVSFLSYFTVLTAVKAAAVGALVVFNQQTPMSAFLTDGDYAWRRRWHRHAFAMVTRAGYATADLIITTSHGVADDLVAAFGVARASVRVVHNPVDLDAVAAAAREPIDAVRAAAWQRPVIVAAGRLAEAKNYPLLIEALALLHPRVPARLFILGQGDEDRAIRALAAARGLDDAVVLCGFQSNPWKYIARADVFALTSHYEGFGNVLVEAMACGVPVVATRSSGTSEIVRDGVDGLLVDRHEPAAVAAALERVLGDEPFRRRLAAEARAGAERFALPAIAREYESVLGELAA
jgi:glycosyltransferase involved in cell wall biosynthesis